MSKVNNTSIVVNVNNFQPAYDNLGLGPIPPGTTADSAIAAIQTALGALLSKSWPASYSPYVEYQEDSAIMAPWSDNIPGTAPLCATQAITLDFQNWGLPVDNPTITNMAKEITQQISNHAGTKGTFYGIARPTSSETIYWGVSFTTAVVVDNPEEIGIIYAFSACFALN